MPKQKKKSAESIQDVEISLKELVDVIRGTHLKWSERRVQQLVVEKDYPKGSTRGKYPVIRFLQRIIDEQKDLAEQSKAAGKKSDYEAKREYYKLLKEEIEFHKEYLHSIISVDDHQERIEAIVGTVVSYLEMLPRKISGRYANTPANELKKGVKELIDNIRDELANISTYRLQVDDSSGSTGKNVQSRTKSASNVRAEKKARIKRMGK